MTDPATQIPERSGESSPRSRHTRLIALLVAGVLIAGAAAAWRHFVYARPVGSGPASPHVPREPFETQWSSRRVILLGLGDSVTDGLGASAGKSYFKRLVSNLADEFDDLKGSNLSVVLPRLKAVNRSVSGMTSIECVDHQLPKLSPYPPEVFGVVVMTVGGNDVVHNYVRTRPREGAMYGASVTQVEKWLPAFNDRLETLAASERTTFPGGIHMIVADIYDPPDGDSDTHYAGLPA